MPLNLLFVDGHSPDDGTTFAIVLNFLAESAPEGHRRHARLPRPLVEDLTRFEGRAIQVQGDGLRAVTRVLHTMKPQLVAHVGDVVDLAVGALLLEHFALFGEFLVRPKVSRLPDAAAENLDEAVGVSVVVDRRRVALGPAQQHQVELAVALVDEIARVLILVELGEFVPVGLLGVVPRKQLFDFLDVDAFGVEDFEQLFDELVPGDGSGFHIGHVDGASALTRHPLIGAFAELICAGRRSAFLDQRHVSFFMFLARVSKK